MAKPSIYKQVKAVAVSGRNLIESPRHWNCGLLRYKDRLWLAYRFHLKHHNGRCATAIVQLHPTTYQPMGESQWLQLSGPTGNEHHEDARLFMCNGEVYISYTEMRGYRPGVDYTCVMKYAKLKLGPKNLWRVIEVFHPAYGANDGRGKEKNWVFFEYDQAVHAVYSGAPDHLVIRLEGNEVVERYVTPAPIWHWGYVRGGTPPLLQKDETFLSIFHSSVKTEIPPHYVRYLAGAYTFEARPPFTPLKISMRPMMSGSEEDGHKVDPRYMEGWKPYVVFPCGLIPEPDGSFLCSLGVNDWQCAIARLSPAQFHLGAVDGSDVITRYFRRENGSMPIKIVDDDQRTQFLNWLVPKAGVGMAGIGYMKVGNPREAEVVAEFPNVDEITEIDYERAFQVRIAH